MDWASKDVELLVIAFFPGVGLRISGVMACKG